MSLIVETHGLTKRYRGQAVVAGVDLRIPRGVVYGFLGPNGAGKSTTMKMLLDLVRPSEGEVRIDGRIMDRASRGRLLGRIGSLIEAPPGYGHLTGAENLRIVQRQLGLAADDVERAVGAVRLGDQLGKRVRDYSLGMKQRLGIAMALARRPTLLILDEPTNGLDPAGIEEIRVLLRRLAHQGVTVMVSSHQLGEIDKTATMIGILARGRLLFQGSRADLVSATVPDLVVECTEPRHAASLLGPAAWVDAGLVRVPDLRLDATPAVVETLVRGGVRVLAVYREQQRLEDVFMRLTRGGGL